MQAATTHACGGAAALCRFPAHAHRCISLAHSAWTNKLITAKDHASVQVNIGHLNEEGVYSNQFTTFALAGRVRAQVRNNEAVNGAWQPDGWH
jgi:hypothetical protein